MPKLDDAVALEFENVNHGHSQLARLVSDAGVNSCPIHRTLKLSFPLRRSPGGGCHTVVALN